jgi:undecaprenyl-diphosphatase
MVDVSRAWPIVAVGERTWTHRDRRRVIGAGGALVIGGIIAKAGVPELERDVFEAINGLPGALYPVIWPVMQLGSLGGGLLAATSLGIATRRKSVAAISAGAVVSAWVAAKVVKQLVHRARPFEVGLEVVVYDHVSKGLGYVSGHAAVVFAVYTIAAPHLRPFWRRPALALAVLVGVARVQSGAHLPFDVVGGAGLGVLIGEAFRVWESALAKRHAARHTVLAQ